VIQQAFALIDKVLVNDPASASRDNRISLRAKLSANLERLPVGERESVGNRLLAVIALETFLDLHFREPKPEKPEETPDSIPMA
jgi:hypothetical protein